MSKYSILESFHCLYLFFTYEVNYYSLNYNYIIYIILPNVTANTLKIVYDHHFCTIQIYTVVKFQKNIVDILLVDAVVVAVVDDDDFVNGVAVLQVVDELEIFFAANLAPDLFDLHRAGLRRLNPDFVLVKKC